MATLSINIRYQKDVQTPRKTYFKIKTTSKIVINNKKGSDKKHYL